MMKNIFVRVDFSKASKNPAEYAVSLAASNYDGRFNNCF